MYYPSKEEFIKLAKKGNIVPVYRDILADFETPLSAYQKISGHMDHGMIESYDLGETFKPEVNHEDPNGD